jgi:oxygen-independent coproporphyrinogen-3 oxidase
MAEHGINRLSLGVQSTDDRILKFLGRVHNAREADTVDRARQTERAPRQR